MKNAIFRRLVLTGILATLLAASTILQVENTQLVSAIDDKSKQTETLPRVDPVEPPPEPSVEPTPTPTPTPSPTVANIEAIRAKLKADGCNLLSDPGVVKRELGRCKFLMIGDSLGNNLGYGMISQLNYKTGLTFTLKAKASTGLSNAWFYNWHNNLATFLKTYKPNLVIVFLGANDRQNYVVNGVVQTFGTEAWKKTYRSNITRLATSATKAGAYVLWIGMPIMKPYNYAKGITLIDEQFALAVPKVPGATYLPLRAYTADAQGNYRQSAYVNGKYSVIRGDDGIHFSWLGQHVIATYTINAINRTYHVRLVPNNPRYITR